MDEVKMKGDTLQVNFDDTGDHFILLWRDKVGQVHITGPGTFHAGDIKVINMPPKPPSPPAEIKGAYCPEHGRNLAYCAECLHEKMNPPAEVPEVEYADIRIRKVRVMEEHLQEIAKRTGHSDEDLIIVKTFFEKVEGSPMEYLQRRMIRQPIPPTPAPTPDNATDLQCLKYGKEAGKKGCDDCTGCTIPGCKLKDRLKEMSK